MTDATWDRGEGTLTVGGVPWKLWATTDPVWTTPNIGQSIGGEIPDTDDHPEARLVRALRDAIVERDRLRGHLSDVVAYISESSSWIGPVGELSEAAERGREIVERAP